MRINRYNDYEYGPVLLEAQPIKIVSVGRFTMDRQSQIARSNLSSCSSKYKQRKGLKLSKDMMENKENQQTMRPIPVNNSTPLIGRNRRLQKESSIPSKKVSLKINRDPRLDPSSLLSPRHHNGPEISLQNNCVPFRNTTQSPGPTTPRHLRQCFTVYNQREPAVRYQVNEVEPSQQYFGGSIIDLLLIPSQKNM